MEVQKHLAQEKIVSAVMIQALWRGHMTRKHVTSRQKVVRTRRAAVCIQRGVSDHFNKKYETRHGYSKRAHLEEQIDISMSSVFV